MILDALLYIARALFWSIATLFVFLVLFYSATALLSWTTPLDKNPFSIGGNK